MAVPQGPLIIAGLQPDGFIIPWPHCVRNAGGVTRVSMKTSVMVLQSVSGSLQMAYLRLCYQVRCCLAGWLNLAVKYPELSVFSDNLHDAEGHSDLNSQRLFYRQGALWWVSLPLLENRSGPSLLVC